MISMSLLGIHPTFPSSISISFQSPNLLLIETFVPSCRINKSVPLASGELFTVTVGANTIALFRYLYPAVWLPLIEYSQMTNTKNTSPR